VNIVFDIGNVLIAWDPYASFRHAFASDAEVDAFLADADFYAWNLEQDRGRSRKEAVAAVPEPHAALLDGYFDRFHLTIQDKISESWLLMEQLRAEGHGIYGLTNFAPDTWPVALEVHPQLGEVFEDVVVSGHEGVIKPDREIYDLLCRRNMLSPGECLFIDDSAVNAQGARDAGWQAHHFTGADGLRRELTERGAL